MTRNRCPETVYGEHGAPNASGRCPYCGERLCARRSKARQFTPNYQRLARLVTEREYSDDYPKVIGLRVTPAEIDAIDERAKAAGYTNRGAYLRSVIFPPARNAGTSRAD